MRHDLRSFFDEFDDQDAILWALGCVVIAVLALAFGIAWLLGMRP